MRAFIKEKRFGSKLVLHDVSVTMETGRRIAITGPSGAGKTTLLRILSGLDRDYEGRVDEPFSLPAVLFQEDRLIEPLTVSANLRAVSDDDGAIGRALAATGLASEGRSIVSALSGGMKRRLAISRLLLLDKDAVYLDEPFRALDEGNRRRAASSILSWAGEAPIVFVTHDEEDMELLHADVVISL